MTATHRIPPPRRYCPAPPLRRAAGRRPHRHRHGPLRQGVIGPGLLAGAWEFLGTVSAVLVLGGFVVVLHNRGWHLNAPVGTGTPLHHLYLRAP